MEQSRGWGLVGVLEDCLLFVGSWGFGISSSDFYGVWGFWDFMGFALNSATQFFRFWG